MPFGPAMMPADLKHFTVQLNYSNPQESGVQEAAMDEGFHQLLPCLDRKPAVSVDCRSQGPERSRATSTPTGKLAFVGRVCRGNATDMSIGVYDMYFGSLTGNGFKGQLHALLDEDLPSHLLRSCATKLQKNACFAWLAIKL